MIWQKINFPRRVNEERWGCNHVKIQEAMYLNEIAFDRVFPIESFRNGCSKENDCLFCGFQPLTSSRWLFCNESWALKANNHLELLQSLRNGQETFWSYQIAFLCVQMGRSFLSFFHWFHSAGDNLFETFEQKRWSHSFVVPLLSWKKRCRLGTRKRFLFSFNGLCWWNASIRQLFNCRSVFSRTTSCEVATRVIAINWSSTAISVVRRRSKRFRRAPISFERIWRWWATICANTSRIWSLCKRSRRRRRRRVQCRTKFPRRRFSLNSWTWHSPSVQRCSTPTCRCNTARPFSSIRAVFASWPWKFSLCRWASSSVIRPV